MECPNCHAEIPAKARFCLECSKPNPTKKSSGISIGDVGLIKELHIGTEKPPPTPGGDYCPIRGVWARLKDSFRCRQCGRTGLHHEHRDSELNMCSECAAKIRPVPAAPMTPPKAASQGNEIVLTLAIGVEMVFMRVPAGSFLMGSKKNDKVALEEEKPQHKVHLEEYWIGKTPVTNAQYQAFVDASGHGTPRGWESGKPPNGKRDHPVVNVFWQDAQAFCIWAGEITKEAICLPSEAEWEKAARGADGRKYPWGNKAPDVKLCNFDKNIRDTTWVGRYSPQGDSPYGCADMAGNVWEWTNSLWGKHPGKPDFIYPFRAGDGRENPQAEGLRVLRGGSWSNYDIDIRSAYRYWYSPSQTFSHIGFRCARSQ